MKIQQMLKMTEKWVTDNSPVILTAVGVVGTISTAYLTGRASIKAYEILQADKPNLPPQTPHTKKQILKLVWTQYIPPFLMGTATVCSIIFANKIGTRRAAALAAAYTVLDQSYDDYRNKVVEILGKNKDEKVRAAVAQDQVDANPLGNQQVIVVNGGDALCMEAYSGRYFRSTVEDIRRAQNDVNAQIIHGQYACLADFYSALGIPPTENSFEVGWNTDNMLDVEINATIGQGGEPCLVLSYKFAPIREYYNFR